MNQRRQMTLAARIVRKGADNVRCASIEKSVGEFRTYSDNERSQADKILRLTNRYANVLFPKAPLCFAVFGDPGSGKSTFVKQIPKATDSPDVQTINLSQLSRFEELSDALADLASRCTADSLPIILFDEFDTALGNREFGWLSWFLAPMNDGKWIRRGVTHHLRRAVYAFAGGTAATFADFVRASTAEEARGFRLAKGPDFISRLHGHIDIRGVNEPLLQPLRRAVAIDYELRQLCKAENGKRVSIRGSLINELLTVPRYIHGARSIAAIIEMCKDETLPSDRVVLSTVGLGRNAGSEKDRELHIDRGVLDPKRVGGSIQFSAGAATAADQQRILPVWTSLAIRLWREGAIIGYGGLPGTKPRGTHRAAGFPKVSVSLADLIRHEARKLPQGLMSGSTRLKLFRPQLSGSSGQGGRKSAHTSYQFVPGPSSDERQLIKTLFRATSGLAKRRATHSLALFRMRYRIAAESIALICLGGKTKDWSGRMPGLVEEVMLALAFRRPIYICGGFGGAAEHLGDLLHLSQKGRWPAIPREFTSEHPRAAELGALEERLLENAQWGVLFRPLPHPRLARTMQEAVEYVAEHPVDSDKWPFNGLSREENRELFESKTQSEIADLIVNGVRRCLARSSHA